VQEKEKKKKNGKKKKNQEKKFDKTIKRANIHIYKPRFERHTRTKFRI
jgi:hypothetical protein